jgi:hypothetical protein
VVIPPDITGKFNNFDFTFQKACPVDMPRRNSRTGGFSYNNTSKELTVLQKVI